MSDYARDIGEPRTNLVGQVRSEFVYGPVERALGRRDKGATVLTPEIMEALTEFRTPAGRHLDSHIVEGFHRGYYTEHTQLMRYERDAQGRERYVPTASSAAFLSNLRRERGLLTIDATRKDGFTKLLNTALAGGESYPVLITALGLGIPGVIPSLIFAAATTLIDVDRPHFGVQVRDQDEVWQVEEIGKVRNGTAWDVTHVNCYFIVDKYRQQAPAKGWLIHEDRHVLSI